MQVEVTMSIDSIGSDWPLPAALSKTARAGEMNTAVETRDAVSLRETGSEQPAAAKELHTPGELETPIVETNPEQKASDRERFRRTAYVFQRVLKELQALPVFSDLVEAAIPEAMREDTERDPHPSHAPIRHDETIGSGEDRFARSNSTFDRKV